MMDPVKKKEWVAGLRSKQYKQGFGKLRSADDEFCSLGVLLDLCLDEGHWQFIRSINFHVFHVKGTEKNSWESGFVPPALRVKYDLSSDAASRLTELNDKKKWTFEQIADYIDANL